MAAASRVEPPQNGRIKSTGGKPVIALRNVGKTFADLVALSAINLEIYPGEFFILVGPSGCGKSTLLRIMSGLEKSFEGEMRFGDDVNRRDFSFVFQQFALLPWLTVFQNVELGLLARNTPSAERARAVKAELERFGLQKFGSAYPKELSGGMKQRVGIARALAIKPKVIFMDEPFSELDSFTAEELRQEFLTIWRKTRTTIIMVTHLIEEAIELADRIAVLTPRPATIEKIVVNSLPRPRQERSEAFYRLEDQLYQLVKP